MSAETHSAGERPTDDWMQGRSWWLVVFATDRSDGNALTAPGIFEVMHTQGVRRIGVGRAGFEESDDLAALSLELLAESGPEARERAEGLMLRARRAAKLRDEVPSVALVNLLSDAESSSARFLEKAEALLKDEDEADMTVIAAQIHLEVQVRVLLARAAERQGSDAENLMTDRPTGNLRNERTQALVEQLLGVRVKELPEWQEFKNHVVRRNKIVHEGLAVGLPEAQISVSVTRAIARALAEGAVKGEAGESQ